MDMAYRNDAKRINLTVIPQVQGREKSAEKGGDTDMKKLIALVMVVILLVSLSGVALASKDEPGNGAPSGPHYNLNIIGVPKAKIASMNNNSGHRIFVNLEGKSKVWLTEGDFQVLDANGTDGNGAKFQLPNPDPENDGVTEYSVFIRPLGKVGGKADITTSAYYDDDGFLLLKESVLSVGLERGKGKQSFENVSKELLYIYVDLDEDGIVERYALFDSALQDYFWDYDNNGLKLAQLRFYEIPTNVN
jgi:hypothetical protein